MISLDSNEVSPEVQLMKCPLKFNETKKQSLGNFPEALFKSIMEPSKANTCFIIFKSFVNLITILFKYFFSSRIVYDLIPSKFIIDKKIPSINCAIKKISDTIVCFYNFCSVKINNVNYTITIQDKKGFILSPPSCTLFEKF